MFCQGTGEYDTNPTTVPSDGTTPPETPPTEPEGSTTAPTLSQLPIVGTDGETKPTEAPVVQEPSNPLNIWYILIPCGALLLLLLLLLLRKKKKES